jgi:hypothetical protein
MNTENRNLDGLLRRNAERQLRDFDWDRLRATVLGRVVVTSAREGRSGGLFRRVIARAVVGVAAALILVVGYLGYLRVHTVGPEATRPSEIPTTGEFAGDDGLLASTDPETILLSGPTRLLAANDPLLSPHSVWDQ